MPTPAKAVSQPHSAAIDEVHLEEVSPQRKGLFAFKLLDNSFALLSQFSKQWSAWEMEAMQYVKEIFPGFASLVNALRRTPKIKTKYTLRQAFFIVSGGLVVPTRTFHPEPQLTITPAGAIELARLGHLEPIPKEIIDDKSKADLMTKVLVCIQAGWFIIQCVSRVAQNLPLPLLEVHVLAHVLVALLMYLFWFAKPYSVSTPVTIADAQVVELAAFLTLDPTARKYEFSYSKPAVASRCVVSRCVLSDGFSENSAWATLFPTREQLGFTDRTVSQSEEGDTSPRATDKDSPKPGELDVSNTHRRLTGTTEKLCGLSESQSYDVEIGPSSPEPLPDSQIEKAISRDRTDEVSLASSNHTSPYRVQLDGQLDGNVQTPSEIERKRAEVCLVLAQKAFHRLKSANMHFNFQTSRQNLIIQQTNYFAPYLGDLTSFDCYDISCPQGSAPVRRNRDIEHTKKSIWTLLVSSLNGAFHLGAWNAHFPTSIERWIWRAAGLAMGGTSVVILLAVIIVILLQRAWEAMKLQKRPRWVQIATTPVILVVGMVLGTIYVIVSPMFPSLAVLLPAGRLYFLVESVVSLRSPEPGIYETVKWTQFWPHG